MSASQVDAFTTPGIVPPPAFNRLRAELQRAADPARIAEHRTRRALIELRHRANEMFDSWELHQGTGLGEWYATLAARYMDQADRMEADAKAAGVLS